MHALIYHVTPEALERWSRSNCTSLRNCAKLLRFGDFLGLYDQSGSLDILKHIHKNVAFWLDYDLIPVDIAVGKIE